MWQRQAVCPCFFLIGCNLTSGKWFSSCWPVLAVRGPTAGLPLAIWSFIFKMDDEAPYPPLCLFLFFLPVFSRLCRNTVGGRLHSCSGHCLSLHKCPSFISQAEGRLYRSAWLTIIAAGVERRMSLPHSLSEQQPWLCHVSPQVCFMFPRENDLQSVNTTRSASSALNCLW